MGKIEENNPEILAQKILETGRQIEAGKLLIQKNKEKSLHAPDNALMPAPATIMKVQPKQSSMQTSNMKTSPQMSAASKILHESPKVVNFEDRLKSIITSVLNEDQEQRKAHDVRRVPTTQSSAAQQSLSITNNLPIVTTAHLNASTTISPVNAPSNPGNYIPNYKHQQSGNKVSPTLAKQKAMHYPQHQTYPAVIYPIQQHPNASSGSASHPDHHHTNIRELHHHEELLKQEFAKAEAEDIYPRTSSAESLYISRYQQQHPARPGSSSSQPDYTQVSPAKMALRRHLSQEKLSQQSGGSSGGGGSTIATKTIGDLVNGEIERTLEISNQSIINAAVNMSAMLNNNAPTNPPAGPNHSVINWNAQRPERVGIRLNEAGGEIIASYPGQVGPPVYPQVTVKQSSTSSAAVSANLHGHNNLATLAHVAYNHKQYNPEGVPTDAPPPPPPSRNALSSHKQSSRTQYPTSAAMAAVYQQQQSSGRNSHPNVHYQQTSASSVPPSGRVSEVPAQSQHVMPPQSKSQQQPPLAPPQTYHQLPRAELKPYIESYFNEEQKPLPILHQAGTNGPPLEERMPRVSTNPPLEGLAASLQARVIATLNIKEESEEKARRDVVHQNIPNHIIQSTQIKSEGSVNLKRHSPISQNATRPAKHPLYSELYESYRKNGPPLMSPEINSSAMQDSRHMMRPSVQQRQDDGRLTHK